jgi:integrase
MPSRKHPKRKLTTRFIDSIKPPATGRITHWDAHTPGFGLRVTPAGSKSWVLVYRHNGEWCRWTIGAYPQVALADARKRAWGGIEDVGRGKNPAAEKREERERDTFKELAEDFIELYAKPNKRSWKEDRRALDRDLLPEFGHRKAAEIRRRHVISLLDRIKARGAPVLANRTLEIMRRIYNWGIQKERVEQNPCIGIEAFAEQSRDRVLSEAELRTVWAALDTMPALVSARFRLLLTTAQRSSEVRTMRWQDVDLDTGWWTIPAEVSKNRLSHRVPLSTLALMILDGAKEATGGKGLWVFPSSVSAGPVADGHKWQAMIRNTSGVTFRPHDLRRTAASHMASMGVSRFTIGRILNHVETSVTATYDRHSYDAEKRTALDAWAQRMGEIIAGKRADGGKVVPLRPATR